MLNNETLEPFPPNQPHSDSSTSHFLTLLTEVQTLLVPLKTKIPSPKVIKKSLPRHYCKCKVANNHDLNSEGEEVKQVTMDVWAPSLQLCCPI